jgi:hypothetical protein
LKLSSSLINIESSDVFFYCRECGRNLNNQISRLEFSFNIHLHGFPYTCVWMPCHLKLSIMYVYIMLRGPSSDTCANIKFHHATTLLERKEPDWFGIFSCSSNSILFSGCSSLLCVLQLSVQPDTKKCIVLLYDIPLNTVQLKCRLDRALLFLVFVEFLLRFPFRCMKHFFSISKAAVLGIWEWWQHYMRVWHSGNWFYSLLYFVLLDILT